MSLPKVDIKRVIQVGGALFLGGVAVGSAVEVKAAEIPESQTEKQRVCLEFGDVANINYIPTYWNEKNGRYESIFSQNVQKGQPGYVEEVEYGGADMTMVSIPVGADVTGFDNETTVRHIVIDANANPPWIIDSYETCYRPKSPQIPFNPTSTVTP